MEPPKWRATALRGNEPIARAGQKAEPQRESASFQRMAIHYFAARPGFAEGGLDQDAGVLFPRPVCADARTVGADVFRGGIFGHHRLCTARKQYAKRARCALFFTAVHLPGLFL